MRNATCERGLRFLFAGIVALFVAALLASPAIAQDEDGDDRNRLQRGHDVCVETGVGRDIVDELYQEGLISESEKNDATGLFSYEQDKVDALREQHAERWDEIQKDKEDSRGLFGKAGKVVESGICWAGSPVNAGIEAVNNSPFWGDPIGKFVKSVMEGNTEALTATMTFWMDFSTTSVDIAGNTQGVKNIVMGVSGMALIASFIYGGYRIASSRRGGLQEGVTELNDNMLRWLIFSIAVPAMVPGAMVASDALADAIMEQFGNPETIINLGGIEDEVYGPIVTLILSFIVLAGSLVQMLALVTRVLLAPIAAGLTPLFAALSFSSAGRQGLNHLVAFLISIIAFKPVSALLYAVVLWNVSGTEEIDGTQMIINALMIGIAGFSAPALVRAVVPAVAQAGGGGAAPMLAGATGAAGAGLAMAGAASRGVGSAVGALGKGGATGAQSGGNSPGGGSGGGSAAGSGASGPVGPRGGGSAEPGGARGGGGASAATPTSRGGNAARKAGAAGRATARGAGKALAGVGAGSTAVGNTLRQVGSAGYRGQQIFDDSIGVAGNYAGQAHR